MTRLVMRAAAYALILCLSACSLIAPRASPQPAFNRECNLKTLEARKKRLLETLASGTAYALIIRAAPPHRVVSGANPVYFRNLPGSAGVLGVAPAVEGHGDHLVIVPGDDPSRAVLWRITPAHFLSRLWSKYGAPKDGEAIRLQRSADAYWLTASHEGAPIGLSARSAHAATFVINKGDVPDATHPQTCDSEVRDGDFVFLRQEHPPAWVAPDADGVLRAGAPRRGSHEQSTTQRVCVQQKEVCYNNENGLYCAWVMNCPQGNGMKPADSPDPSVQGSKPGHAAA